MQVISCNLSARLRGMQRIQEEEVKDGGDSIFMIETFNTKFSETRKKEGTRNSKTDA